MEIWESTPEAWKAGGKAIPLTGLKERASARGWADRWEKLNRILEEPIIVTNIHNIVYQLLIQCRMMIISQYIVFTVGDPNLQSVCEFY